MTSLKTYWSIQKNIIKQQKNSLHSSFTLRQQILTDFKKFAKQCSIIDNSNKVPLNFLKKLTSLSLQLLSLVMIFQH